MTALFRTGFFLSIFCWLYSNAVAQDGTLIQSFGTAGIARLPLNSPHNALGTAMAVAPDDKVVLVGTVDSAGNRIGLHRATANGVLDAAFGAGGHKIVSLTGGAVFPLAVAVLSDGKIVVCGQAQDVFTSRGQAFVARFLPDGTLDATFNTTGFYIASIPTSGDATATAMAVQPDGKIVAAVETVDGNISEIRVLRLTPSGALDAGFFPNGNVSYQPGPGYASARGITILPDGGIVISGFGNGGSQYFSMRFTPSGQLYTAYGTGGITTGQVLGGTTAFVEGVTYDSVTQGVVLAGAVGAGTLNTLSFAIALDSLGGLRSDFGTLGRAFFTLPSSNANIYDVKWQRDGKLILSGSAVNPPPTGRDAIVVRLKPNGTPDSTFGQDGIAQVNLADGNDVGYTVGYQSTGNIVVGGDYFNGANRYPAAALLRNTVGPSISVSSSPARVAGFVISPNPAQSIVCIRYQLSQALQGAWICLTDAAGRVVQRKAVTSGLTGAQEETLDIATLPKGQYTLSLHSADGRTLAASKLLKR